MTTEDIERFLHAFWASDWSTVHELLRVDAVYEDPLLDAPVGGRSQILEILRFCHSWGELHPSLRTVFGDGTHFCAEIHVSGKVISATEGIPETAVGRSFDFVEADIFEVRDGGIARMSIYADVVRLNSQLGI